MPAAPLPPGLPSVPARGPLAGPPHVLILMASRQGGRWLARQLDSIAAQRDGTRPDGAAPAPPVTGWSLWVSDDGSTDATRQIVADFAHARAGRNEVRLVEGPRLGSAGANFLTLLARPDLPLGPETHVAFADQDDIWHPDKLARALARLGAAGGGARAGAPAVPMLYGAQSRHVDEAGRPTGTVSRRPRRPVTLANALVQNLVSGHSAVLNPAAVALARRCGAPPGVVFHDWWLAQLVLGCGGRLVIDEATVLDYRQHGRQHSRPGRRRHARAPSPRAAPSETGLQEAGPPERGPQEGPPGTAAPGQHESPPGAQAGRPAPGPAGAGGRGKDATDAGAPGTGNTSPGGTGAGGTGPGEAGKSSTNAGGPGEAGTGRTGTEGAGTGASPTGGNTLGAPAGLAAGRTRLALLARGAWRDWIAANLAALAAAPLVPEARATVEALIRAPRAGPGRLAVFCRLGLHRQSRRATLALWLAALAGRS